MENVKIVEPIRRYQKIDMWRGYPIPACAVAGASDTGEFSDSPCPSDKVKAELALFCKEVLRPLGISYRTVYGGSSNCFMQKRWIVVKKASFNTAAFATLKYLEEHEYKNDLEYMHDANLVASNG